MMQANPSVRARVITVIQLALLAYLLLAIGMFVFQRKIIYFPDTHIENLAHYNVPALEELLLTTPDGVTLIAWHAKAKTAMPTLIYFHGNAGNIGSRADKFKHFTEAGLGLLAVSYRGYGKSEGTPSEHGIYEDARTAVRYALEQLKLPPGALVLYGESLGSGVAVQMGTEFKLAGIILEAPYTSVADRGAELYPYLPAHWIVRDTFNSLAKIAQVHMPLLLLHGEMDKTIPIAHGKKIFAAANEPKTAIYFPETGHTDFKLDALTDRVLEFIAAEHLALRH